MMDDVELIRRVLARHASHMGGLLKSARSGSVMESGAMQATDEVNRAMVLFGNFTATIAAQRERIARLEREVAWQPIETAPRDGTRILIGDPTSVAIGRWGRRYYAAGHPTFAWLDDYDQPFLGFRPTRWRLLPTPPAASETKEDDGE